jgi:hypothetical protein
MTCRPSGDSSQYAKRTKADSASVSRSKHIANIVILVETCAPNPGCRPEVVLQSVTTGDSRLMKKDECETAIRHLCST